MAQIVTMGIRPANQHAIFFHHPEPGRCLAGTGQGTLPAVGAQSPDESGAFGGDAGTAGEGVEGDAFTEEDFANGAADGGAVVGWRVGEGVAFFNVPLDPFLLLLARLPNNGSSSDTRAS